MVGVSNNFVNRCFMVTQSTTSKKKSATQGRHEFGAEVGKLLKLLTHSLYTNSEIFFRELISNASDACDKLRYAMSTDSSIVADRNLKIDISADPEAKILTITDNGIGMDEDELCDNLGTIARSGTQNFMQALQQQDSKDKKSLELIGQFGVGFYSVFMVSDDVSVYSRKVGSKDKGWIWSSSGEGEFTLQASDEELPYGTSIKIHIKEGQEKYLDKFHIEHVVTTFLDYISFPINFLNDKGESEQLNSAVALWLQPKSEITDEQYKEFYRGVAHLGGDPWMTLHNYNEGTTQYTNLLFIPSLKPFDLYSPERKCSVRLYSNKVFITEDNVKIIPSYLRFLRGVIDSEDLPLNVSRETLQDNAVVGRIRTSLIKKVLGELKSRAEADPEGYTVFCNNFMDVLKEGLCEAMDTDSRERLMSVCRFYSLQSGDRMISLDEYIAKMPEQQKDVFYLNADNLDAARKSPQLEGFSDRGVDVILLVNPVDDFWTSVVMDYKNHKLQSVGKSDINLDALGEKKEDESVDAEQDSKFDEETIQSVLTYCKSVLGDKVGDVLVSKKLTNSPVCLTIKDGAMNIRMERMLREQRQLAHSTAKIMEINPKHPIVKGLIKEYSSDGESDKLADIIGLLWNQACLLEGEPIADVSGFAGKINSLLQLSLNHS